MGALAPTYYIMSFMLIKIHNRNALQNCCAPSRHTSECHALFSYSCYSPCVYVCITMFYYLPLDMMYIYCMDRNIDMEFNLML